MFLPSHLLSFPFPVIFLVFKHVKRLNAGLSHRNIVRFRGVSSAMPDLGIVLEYVDGGTMKQRLDASTIEPSTVIDWAMQIAKGMDYLHDGVHEGGSIIHRDLKSANILVTKNDVLKITDFGLSRLHFHTTRIGMGGTIAWMAPEAIRCTYCKGVRMTHCLAIRLTPCQHTIFAHVAIKTPILCTSSCSTHLKHRVRSVTTTLASSQPGR